MNHSQKAHAQGRHVRHAVLWLFAIVGAPAFALDLSSTAPPTAVTDNLAGVGSRGVELTGEGWHYLSYARGSISPSPAYPSVAVHTGYFAQVLDGRLAATLLLTMPEGGYQVSFWNNDPCRGEGRVHKTVMDASVKFPQCLIINRHESLHRGATGALFQPVLSWMSEKKISMPAAYDIHYVYYASSGHGHVRVYVPTSAFGSDQAAIEWGQKLAEHMRPLLDQSVRKASLPALPPMPR